MFNWWNQSILPRSSVKWNYPVLAGVVWVSAKYYLNRTLVGSEVALDLLTILFASIALASIQAMFNKPKKEEPIPSKHARATQLKAKQHKRKTKRHP